MRIITILIATCMLFGLFAGCSNTTNGNNPTQQPGNGDPTNTPVETNNAGGSIDNNAGDLSPDNYQGEVAEEDKYGGDLVYSYRVDPTLYPPKIASNGTWLIVACAADPLGRMQTDGSFEPFLAESFEEDPEACTFTIHLREGIKFHDGSDFNADALVWLFDEYVENGTAANICRPTSYEATDEYTVVMHFASYDNSWRETISKVYPVSRQAFETYGEDYMLTNVIGTGPFIQTEYELDDHMTFVRNEDYWIEGQPYLDSITIVEINDNTTKVSALMNRETQLLTVNTGSTVTQLQADSGLKDIYQLTAATSAYSWMTPHQVDGPFSDVLVRRALMTCIDREALAQTMTEGLGHAISQLAVEGSWCYLTDDELYDTYDYDPERAKELLTEAGYPDGFEYVLTSNATQQNQAVAVQSYMKAIGIEAEIELLDQASSTEEMNEGTRQVIFPGGNGTGSAASFDSTLLFNRQFGPDRIRYKNHLPSYDELGTLIEKCITATDETSKLEAHKAMGYWVNENLPIIPLYYSINATFAADNLYSTGLHQTFSWQWTPNTAYFYDK